MYGNYGDSLTRCDPKTASHLADSMLELCSMWSRCAPDQTIRAKDFILFLSCQKSVGLCMGQNTLNRISSRVNKVIPISVEVDVLPLKLYNPRNKRCIWSIGQKRRQEKKRIKSSYIYNILPVRLTGIFGLYVHFIYNKRGVRCKILRSGYGSESCQRLQCNWYFLI